MTGVRAAKTRPGVAILPDSEPVLVRACVDAGERGFDVGIYGKSRRLFFFFFFPSSTLPAYPSTNRIEFYAEHAEQFSNLFLPAGKGLSPTSFGAFFFFFLVFQACALGHRVVVSKRKHVHFFFFQRGAHPFRRQRHMRSLRPYNFGPNGRRFRCMRSFPP